jgi:hypothetical protein
MRDWRAYVNERIGSAGFEEIGDVADELAGHLEECYAALRAQGLSEEEACAWTCVRAGNWEELRRGVISAKQEGTIMDRVRQIWVPSLVTLSASFGVMAVVIGAGIQPIISHPGEPRGIILYLPWLLVLPLIGALGAYLSRRAQGTGWRAYLVGAFPAVAILVAFLLILPFRLAIDPYVVHDFQLGALVSTILSWTILPGIALCIGVALEGLRKSRVDAVALVGNPKMPA